MRTLSTIAVIIVLSLPTTAAAQIVPREREITPGQRKQDFNADPGEGRNNRFTRTDLYLVTQDFGFSNTNHAGREPGEIGGTATRSITPAYYADEIEPKTLNDRLSASGTLALTPQRMEGTLHFGWFNSKLQGWRPWSAMGFRILKDGSIALDYMTKTWEAGGAFPKIKVKPDGVKHAWSLTYDPDANNGDGQMTFVLDDHPPEVVKLLPGHKEKGATFDRFGLFNQQSAGGPMTVYFDDLEYDGKRERFSEDPQWEGVDNRVKFREKRFRGAQNYGYSRTNFAGGRVGEIGGIIWRANPSSEEKGYYADKVGPLTLRQPLFASGKVALLRGATDSDLHFGWFKSDGWKPAKNTADRRGPPMLAITIGGPAQSFHFFRPTYATSLEAADRIQRRRSRPYPAHRAGRQAPPMDDEV